MIRFPTVSNLTANHLFDITDGKFAFWFSYRKLIKFGYKFAPFLKINESAWFCSELLLENNFKVIHPCTDCVYKGSPDLAPYGLESDYDCDDLC